MLKGNFLVIGNFGYGNNNLNGQTVRTRTIYETVSNYVNLKGEEINFIDTSVKKSLAKRFKDYTINFLYYVKSKTVILLPAQKAVKIVLPVIVFGNLLFHKRIHLVAIGGWLEEFINKKKAYIKYFKKVDCIYVQTISMKIKLEKIGLENVIHFPNYRVYNQPTVELNEIEKVKKLVFFSRVTPSKGIKLAMEAINKINEKYNYGLSLSIYGPIDKDYKEEFDKTLKDYNHLTYLGVLNPTDILSTLSKYDILLFPTFYEGEGFPGTILDSMTAGIPIIASNWKYNSELLKDGYTGLLFENKNLNDLTTKILYSIENIEHINEMKENCINEAEKYSSYNVEKILLKQL